MSEERTAPEPRKRCSACGNPYPGAVPFCPTCGASSILAAPGAERAEPTVRLPTSEDEAALMVLLGTNWLQQHAPHRLLASPAPKRAEPTRWWIATANLLRRVAEAVDPKWWDRPAAETDRIESAIEQATDALHAVPALPEPLGYGVWVLGSTAPSPIAAFRYHDHADQWCRASYGNRGEVRPLASPTPESAPPREELRERVAALLWDFTNEEIRAEHEEAGRVLPDAYYQWQYGHVDDKAEYLARADRIAALYAPGSPKEVSDGR